METVGGLSRVHAHKRVLFSRECELYRTAFPLVWCRGGGGYLGMALSGHIPCLVVYSGYHVFRLWRAPIDTRFILRRIPRDHDVDAGIIRVSRVVADMPDARTYIRSSTIVAARSAQGYLVLYSCTVDTRPEYSCSDSCRIPIYRRLLLLLRRTPRNCRTRRRI